MTADAQQLINEQKRVGQSAAEVNNEYREASRELAQMGRISSQVYREMQTPLEKYNQKLEALNADLDRGKISQEEYNRAVGHVRDKYEAANGTGGKFQATLMQIGAQAAGIFLCPLHSLRFAKLQQPQGMKQKKQHSYLKTSSLVVANCFRLSTRQRKPTRSLSAWRKTRRCDDERSGVYCGVRHDLSFNARRNGIADEDQR